MRLTIDGQAVAVDTGSTLLDAARALGLDIPALCHHEGYQPNTSCMACVVKVDGRLVPSCATGAEAGMVIESETEEVRDARRMALELLLSDHLGDCVAPCHSACPAGMDIPLMIRQIDEGRLQEAIVTIKDQIAFPAVLGRICPAPCERGCRRGAHDSPAAICLLKRHAADVDLASDTPYLPPRDPASGQRVAVVGAGSTGLSAAYYLLQRGHACTLFDRAAEPGGELRHAFSEAQLPRNILDGEIRLIERLGADLQMNTRVGNDPSLDALRREYDAVLVAAGALDSSEIEGLGLTASANGVEVHRDTLQTPLDGVFAAGNVIRRRNKLKVRCVADGKTAAVSIGQYLSGLPVTGPEPGFSVHLGKLDEEDFGSLMDGASAAARVDPSGGEGAGLSREEALSEARRCLHCSCLGADSCRLRHYAGLYGADPQQYAGERRPLTPAGPYLEIAGVDDPSRPDRGVSYDPGKCIACGLCVQIAGASEESLGLTFVGRGFDVRVGVPFDRSLGEALAEVAERCVAACPTRALVHAAKERP